MPNRLIGKRSLPPLVLSQTWDRDRRKVNGGSNVLTVITARSFVRVALTGLLMMTARRVRASRYCADTSVSAPGADMPKFAIIGSIEITPGRINHFLPLLVAHKARCRNGGAIRAGHHAKVSSPDSYWPRPVLAPALPHLSLADRGIAPSCARSPPGWCIACRRWFRPQACLARPRGVTQSRSLFRLEKQSRQQIGVAAACLDRRHPVVAPSLLPSWLVRPRSPECAYGAILL